MCREQLCRREAAKGGRIFRYQVQKWAIRADGLWFVGIGFRRSFLLNCWNPLKLWRGVTTLAIIIGADFFFNSRLRRSVGVGQGRKDDNQRRPPGPLFFFLTK